MMGNVLQEYLVSLGFSVNQNQLRQFQNTLSNVSRQVESHTAGLVRSYTGAASAVASALMGITGATVALLDQTAKADLEYQKFALRMFMTTDSAKRMKIALDAMGESIEDIAWFPELRERYNEFMREQKGMMPPGSFEDQMRRIRDIRNEFSRFSIIMNYGAQWVGHNLVKYLNMPIGRFQRWLIEVNDWLKENMPVWSDKVAYFFSKIITLGENAGKAVNDLWNALSPREQLLTGVGGLVWLFSKSAFARAVAKILAVTAAIDDFYGYIGGKESSVTLAPIWHHLLSMTKDLKGTLDSLKQSIDDLFETLAPGKWLGIGDFWDGLVVRLGIGGRLAAMAALQLSAQVYRFSDDPVNKAKYDKIQKQIEQIEQSGRDALSQYEEDRKLPYEERLRRYRERDLSASGGRGGTVSERERLAMQYYIANGVDPLDAAAAVGNFYQESGLDPTIVNPTSGAYGVMQLLSPDRVAEFKKYADKQHKPLSDYMTQIEFSMTEPRWQKAMREMQNASSLSEKTKIFSRIYEAPGFEEENLSRRNSFSGQVYQNWLTDSHSNAVGPQSFNTTVGSLNVYVANTNATPEEIAKAVKEELYAEQAWSNARMMREAGTVYG